MLLEGREEALRDRTKKGCVKDCKAEKIQVLACAASVSAHSHHATLLDWRALRDKKHCMTGQKGCV